MPDQRTKLRAPPVTTVTDPILDDLFHECAFRAFLLVAAEQRGWPDCEATRRVAYVLYEEALAEKNSRDRPNA
jgi:hypothetical protein